MKTNLGSKNDKTQYQTNPRAGDTEDGLERNLVEGVALVLPCCAEADVRNTNTSPSEEGGDTAQRQQPVEHFLALGIEGHIAECAAGEYDSNAGKWAAGLVDVGEDFGGVSFLRKRGEGARATVHT